MQCSLTLCEISQWKADIHSWQPANVTAYRTQLMLTSYPGSSMAEHTVMQIKQDFGQDLKYDCEILSN